MLEEGKHHGFGAQADTDIAEQPAWPEAERRLSPSRRQQDDQGGGSFFKSDLPKKLGILVVSKLQAPCRQVNRISC